MMVKTGIRNSALTLTALIAGCMMPAVVAAQNTTSRPVVQPLPSGDVRDLRESLRVLARNPRDLGALIDAGYASLKVQDFEAAIGFFGRAGEVSPEDPRVKMGMASVYLNSGRPIEALRLISEAEAAGASARNIMSDRGLAYDLVGDQLRAQAHYREALRESPGDKEILRRMALSQAIAGNERAFEATLRPLIDQRDFAAFRSQAFGLAILGKNDRAKAVAEAVMPSDLASRITPYLGYMPRLTKAQQAAAANLGIFPRAADIGREDPRIARYATDATSVAASTALARGADNRLAPTGEPLGRTARTTPPAQSVAVVQPVVAPRPVQPAATPSPAPTPAPVARTASTSTAELVMPQTSKPVVGPGFDLEKNPATRTARESAPGGSVTRASDPAARTPSATRLPKPVPKPDPSFADAFADMGNADMDAVKLAGDAVDIDSIAIRREAPPQPKPAPAKPQTPAPPQRYWVQLGTAAQADGLRFDWRRLSRQEPGLLGNLKGHTVPYGSQFRLLAGPVPSRAKRDELVRALTEKGLGVLPYTSPEGTEVKELK